jgi:hypothetical protein
MIRSGHADLPLHGGKVPYWLADRMAKLGGAIIKVIAIEYGRSEVLTRLSDPLWFQSLGCVLGMDWHSSGITTSVMGALKRSINPMSNELGIYICGGRGRHSKKTPEELTRIANQTGLDGKNLIESSRLSAKVDNTAIQDGYQIYLHNFILTKKGEWAVVQQGMNNGNGYARRYHWHSPSVRSFVQEPHASIIGKSQGTILNLVDRKASETQKGILDITKQDPQSMISEIRKIRMPAHHDVRSYNIDLKRLGSVLAVAHEAGANDFESILLTPGLGPRTLQSLALISEVIHGTPTRFNDPARFSFAHGGKDGHPFPVPLEVYDKNIEILKKAIDKSRLDNSDKRVAFRRLHNSILKVEKNFTPNNNFDEVVRRERKKSYRYGGMTVKGPAIATAARNSQLNLFG